jgi:hypothetical protein
VHGAQGSFNFIEADSDSRGVTVSCGYSEVL